MLRTSFFLLLALALLGSCSEPRQPAVPMDLAQHALIPVPASLTATGSSFALTARTSIYVQAGSEELARTGAYLADKLRPATGFPLQVQNAAQAPGAGHIYLKLDPAAAGLGEEGYELAITESLVTLSAAQPAGVFRGVQTLRQLLPASVDAASPQPGPWNLPSGTIRDVPRFGFRGSMLDVARHFFGVDDVKRYIDLMAYYKLNVLHLHLSDDQGWRIEIKSWPNLTAHGGKTEVGGGEGGFYTQEQYSDLVRYAAERYILIIPEIDMPGHTNSALASYPELNCNGKAPDLYTGTNVGFSTLCTDKEITYKFVDDVVRELAALTPGPYIHLGGDESHATKKEDYIPFVNRVRGIVQQHGKTMIGWDETAQTSVDSTSVVQLWASKEYGLEAVRKGAPLIMSPANRVYLDMQYDSTSRLGLHWAGYIEVDTAYLWDPADLVPGIAEADLLGIEAPLWSETIDSMDDIEYLAFPRLICYAEIAWSPKAGRNWDSFKPRLAAHGPRLRAMEVDFYPSARVPWVQK
ncbi:MAG: beta-N-acetylhexosaminidase [Bacteroidia bacterium]|nr:beta-N-acetylhexosaminidase [Bacteroidia bacterium]